MEANMNQVNQSEAISEILKIKTKIDNNLLVLQEERAQVKKRIREIREAKEVARKEKAREFQRHYQLKIELADVQKSVELMLKSVNLARETLKQSESKIWNSYGMTSFGDAIQTLRKSMEGAINYYSEDSLRLELLRQTNVNRDKRVELTRLTNELDRKKKEIDDAKKEKERQRQLELEKERLEAERRQRMAEEKLLAEKEKQREEFLKQKYIPLESAQAMASKPAPFRTISFNTCSPEPELEPESKPSFSGSYGLSSLSGNEADGSTLAPIPTTANGRLPSLSQFTRW